VAAQVRFSRGHDPDYPLKGARQPGSAGERTVGGYYTNAAQKGEPAGRWFGKGAEALGLAEGAEVDHDVHKQVFAQVDPRTGAPIGRQVRQSAADARAGRAQVLSVLLAAEPHATAERRRELGRQAAASFRAPQPYTDVTVTYAKSVSVLHASIRENARQAAMAGDLAREAYWADAEARYSQALFDSALDGFRHLERWAVPRTGTFREVDGEQYGRYESAGLTVSMWLQGTSREGEPHDHVHGIVARMCRTLSDGADRAVDTTGLRQQAGTMKLLINAGVMSRLTGELGVRWQPGRNGTEVRGIREAQREAYSSRAQQVTAETERRSAKFERKYGRAPNRAELRRIAEDARVQTRTAKGDAEIDWDALAARWDKTLGGELAQIAADLGLGPGRAEPGRAGPEGPAVTEQREAMGAALAKVQQKHSTWTRAQLAGELADCLPASMAGMDPGDAQALALGMVDQIMVGEVEPVACLDAPEVVPSPEALRRDLDARSVFTRPGGTRYATEAHLGREARLVDRAAETGAPALERADAARMLGAGVGDLEARLREPAQAKASRAMRPSGLSAAQEAAVYHVLTSGRRCDVIEAPADAGKTHVLAHAARLLRDAGRPVYGLGPTQQSVEVLQAAAAELGVDLPAWNTARFLGQRLDGTYRPRMQVEPGAVLLVDEGSMVSMAHADRIMAGVSQSGGKVVVAQDRQQLAAPEGGGAAALLADEGGVVVLPDPVRFSAQWERDASLRLHAGAAEVLGEYADHGRIQGAPPEEAKDLARRAYVAEHLAGRAPLMLAASNELADEMNDAIRSDLRHLGLVQAGGPEVELLNGKRAAVGDLIALRKIHRDAQSDTPGRGLANGDTLEITGIGRGQVMVRRVLDAGADGQRPSTEPFAFPYANESQLAYAVTGHRAQGRTVTAAISLFTGGEEHEWAYPALTRARDGNWAIIFTLSPRRADPRPGTREAPELSLWRRMQNERRAVGAEAVLDPAAVDEAQLEALGILSRILERPGRELSATQWHDRELRNADHLARLHGEWQAIAGEAARANWEAQLRAALPEDLRGVELGGTATWLWRSLRTAEAAGLDPGQVIRDAVNGRPLTGARDVAAVVDSRIRDAIAGVVPLVPGRWVDQVPPVADPAIRAHLQRRAEQMDARTERLAAHVTETAPAWAVAACGPVPEDPMARLEWQHRIAPVAAYREIFSWAHPTEPISSEPSALTPDKRQAWHGAFASLGPAAGGMDLRHEPDSRLYLMMGTYETVTAAAPRYVAGELRFIRVANRDSELAAVRHEAEAAMARERCDTAAAERHESRAVNARALAERGQAMEARLAAQDEVYREHDQATRYERMLPLAARTELMRRHPGIELPPLRAADPEPLTEEERAALLWPGRDPARQRERAQATTQPQARATQSQPEQHPEPAGAGSGLEREDRDLAAGPGTELEWDEPERDEPKHQAPAWLEDAEQRSRETRDKLAERESETIPSEDPEAGDIGSAWPGVAEPERDAILQPPKPEISAAPEMGGRDAEPETPYTVERPSSPTPAHEPEPEHEAEMEAGE
jgi:AAA domain/TrwC relaxase